jgi:hypothetical protein
MGRERRQSEAHGAGQGGDLRLQARHHRPTVEAVRLKLQDLLERGAVLVQDAELADGVWTAVCEKT